MPYAALLNGKKIEALNLQSRAAQYGDGVFRTMLVVNGQVWLLERQVNKLYQDAQHINLLPPPTAEITESFSSAAQQLGQGIIRASLIAKDTARGYARSGPATDLLLQFSPHAADTHNNARTGIHAQALNYKLGHNPRLAGIKHLNRLDQVLARQQLVDKAAEGLIQNADGLWVSGITSNLFWYVDSCWHTADITSCGVSGVMQAHLAALIGPQLKTEAGLNLEALSDAKTIAVCNSLMGLWPLKSLQLPDGSERHWPVSSWSTGSALRQLQNEIQHPFDNEV